MTGGNTAHGAEEAGRDGPADRRIARDRAKLRDARMQREINALRPYRDEIRQLILAAVAIPRAVSEMAFQSRLMEISDETRTSNYAMDVTIHILNTQLLLDESGSVWTGRTGEISREALEEIDGSYLTKDYPLRLIFFDPLYDYHGKVATVDHIQRNLEEDDNLGGPDDVYHGDDPNVVAIEREYQAFLASPHPDLQDGLDQLTAEFEEEMARRRKDRRTY